MTLRMRCCSFLWPAKCIEDRLVAGLLHLGVEGEHDGVFRGVVVIGAAERHACFGRDVTHGGRFEPFFAKQFHRGVVDLAAGVFRARGASAL